MPALADFANTGLVFQSFFYKDTQFVKDFVITVVVMLSVRWHVNGVAVIVDALLWRVLHDQRPVLDKMRCFGIIAAVPHFAQVLNVPTWTSVGIICVTETLMAAMAVESTPTTALVLRVGRHYFPNLLPPQLFAGPAKVKGFSTCDSSAAMLIMRMMIVNGGAQFLTDEVRPAFGGRRPKGETVAFGQRVAQKLNRAGPDFDAEFVLAFGDQGAVNVKDKGERW